MRVNVAFRHLDPSDALRDYARDKVHGLVRVLGEDAEAHVVLGVEKFRHRAEVSLAARGLAVNGAEETDNMYSAIDLVVDKLGRQVRRLKEKRRESRGRGGR